MLVGVCQIEMLLPACSSLKEKRLILNSVKDKIGNKFNVSIAEVEHQELWQRSILGMALVANEKKLIDQVFNKILKFLHNQDRLEVIEHLVEIY